jgi:PAS domain S-box-containing protein
MMLRLPGSIRLNLILVVLAGVLPVLGVVLGSGWERRQHEIDHAGLTTLRLAEFYAQQQIAEANRLRTILAALAREPVVVNKDATASSLLFKDILLANPNCVNFALIDVTGEALASALPFTKQNLSDRKEFQEALNTGQFAVGEYAVGKVSGVQVLPFAYPVRSDTGMVTGVVIATVRLQDLATVFDQTMMPPDSFVGLADRQGRRLYRHPPTPGAVVGDHIAPKVWTEIQNISKFSLFTAKSTDGLRRVYAIRRVALDSGTPYLNIFVGVPEKTAIDAADMITRQNIVWIGCSLLLSSGLAWVIGRYGIHDRLLRIVETAKSLGAGNLSARSGLTETRGSLGLLARSMDRMAQNLEQDRAALVAAKDALAREASRRVALMDATSDGIVIIDHEHRVLEANRRFATMLGYAPEEVLGLYTWDYEAVYSEEEIRRNFSPPGRVEGVFETCHKRKDGTTFPVEVNVCGSDIFGESLFIAVVRDATARKAVERALQESEERYRTLFESSLDAIALQEGLPPRYIWVNPAFCMLFGYDAETIANMSPETALTLIYADDRETVRNNIAQRLGGGLDAGRDCYRICRADGRIRWVEVTGRRLRLSDRPMHMSIYRDVTEEQERAELLATAKEQAEAASRAKSEFLANMSHEIRTPLNGIVAILQLMEASSLDVQQAGYARMALTASRRLTRLLSDILDISRVEAGKMALVQAPFNIRRAVSEICELLQPANDQSGILCHVSIDARIPEIVVGDCARLQQVLTNLAGNALKFTRQGSVTIEAYPLPETGQGRPRILFGVHDTGIGIPEDKLDLLFEPFSQVDQGYRRDYQGAGLGLAICKRLVGLMGGSISIESEPGVGSSVYFCVTLGHPSLADPRPADVLGRQPVPGSLRLLLVEDETLSGLAIQSMLRKRGHTVTVAVNGREALEKMASGPFDLVFMDVQMPVMDGLEATRRIRAGEVGLQAASTPIIAMTAYAMPGDRERLLLAGMDGYVSKPVDLEALSEAMTTALARQAAREPAPGSGQAGSPA